MSGVQQTGYCPDSYTDNNGCFNADTVYVLIDACVGTGTIQKQNIKLYPNPARDVIRLMTEETDYEVKLFNNVGQVVLSGKNLRSINVSSLSRGIYLLELKGSEWIWSESIVLK